MVAAALGKEVISTFGTFDPRELVAGGTDALRVLMADWGYDENMVQTVCDFVELHAARTLFHKFASIPNAVALVA